MFARSTVILSFLGDLGSMLKLLIWEKCKNGGGFSVLLSCGALVRRCLFVISSFFSLSFFVSMFGVLADSESFRHIDPNDVHKMLFEKCVIDLLWPVLRYPNQLRAVSVWSAKKC